MIALAFVLQAAAGQTLLGAIGQQSLPATGCAAYLWSAAGDRQLVAMAVANPAHIRLALAGAAPADLARTTEQGAPALGFAQSTEYKAGDVTATLDMTIETRPDLAAGATVPRGALRIDRAGQDSVVVPIAGLIGCAS